MPLRILLTVMLLFVVLLLCFPTYAQDSMGMLWKGTVTFEYFHSPKPDESSASDDKKTASHRTEITNKFTATAAVCGVNLARGYVKSASADYIELSEEILKYKESRCEPEGEIKRPGYTEETKATYYSIVAPGFIKTDINSSLTVNLTPSGEMKYKLQVAIPAVDMAIRIGSQQTRSSDPCSGSKSSHEIQMIAEGMLPETTECTDDGSHCRSFVNGTPLTYPLTVVYEGTVNDGKSIIGSTVVTSKTYSNAITSSLRSGIREMTELLPPEMRAEIGAELAGISSGSEDRPSPKKSDPENEVPYKVKVSWTLDRVSPCDEVIDQLRQDLAMVMAYGEDELFEQAEREGWNGEQYDNGAFGLGVKYYQAKWWQSESLPSSEGLKPKKDHDTASMDLAVDDKTCRIDENKRREAKKNQRRSCSPDILYDSLLAHEETHGQQCSSEDTAAEYASRTPESFRKFEHEAYCVGVRHLLNWAEKACPEPDVKPLSEAYRTYCK